MSISVLIRQKGGFLNSRGNQALIYIYSALLNKRWGYVEFMFNLQNTKMYKLHNKDSSMRTNIYQNILIVLELSVVGCWC